MPNLKPAKLTRRRTDIAALIPNVATEPLPHIAQKSIKRPRFPLGHELDPPIRHIADEPRHRMPPSD